MMQFRPTAARFLLFSFSAASLALLPIWFSLFQQRSTPFDDNFFFNHHQLPYFARLDYLAGALVLLAITLFLFALFVLAQRFGPAWDRRLAMAIAAVLLLHGLNVVRTHYLPWASSAALLGALYEYPILAPSALLAGSIVLGIATFRLRKPLVVLVFLGAPVGLVVMANIVASVAVLGKTSIVAEPAALAPLRAAEGDRLRVVWILFDELDFRLAFEDRPAGLDLPNFDRMRAAGLFATHAIPPGGSTFPSIPALTIGKPLAKASFAGDSGPVVSLEGQIQDVPWGSLPSVFSRARGRGGNVGVLGQQYIPYCRVFHKDVSLCWEWGSAWPTRSRTALEHSVAFGGRLLSYVPIVNRHFFPEKFDTGLSYLQFQNGVRDAVTDPRLSLVFVHWMIPHTPYVYDRKTASFTLPNEKTERYFDNIALADRILGETIATLGQSGVADRTVIIVSSDHGWRRSPSFDGRSDPRVPFILLQPGGGDGMTYWPVFNTIVTQDLVLALLEGKLASYRDVASFIERRSLDSGVKRQ